MAQKTNLNVSPYFDDFSEENVGARDKNYYKVLFNPGKPIQARELNTLQSILQDQIESFGSHIFKDGSLVIPGNITYDPQFTAVKVNLQQYGVDVTSYLSGFIGKKIVGQISGITATIQSVQNPSQSLGIEYPTLYVKYLNSDSNNEINPFQDDEPLYSNETVGSILANTPFANTITTNATATGSAVSINEGVYFIRGTFVRVPKQTIILDYYTNTPSYRVGLRITENTITAKDDSSLYDNAKGFTNYAAPGADRFKISLSLTKKLLTDTNDTDFVELLRLKDGGIKKVEVKSSYSIIRDYLAQRTYDESGDYVIDPFEFTVNNSLNDRLGNDGIFFNTEKTEQLNTPSDDLMCIKFAPGKAYVRGYDVEKTGIEILDVEKPRTTQAVSSVNVPFEMGNLLRVNNVSGVPKQKQEVYFQNQRKNSTIVAAGSTIGSARFYNFSVTDAAYTGSATNWNLYLYDVQTYTELTLNQAVSAIQLPATSFIKGKSSGASGYAVSAGAGTSVISIRQKSGSFNPGEAVTINGSDLYPRSIVSIKNYGIEDIKSVHQPTGVSGFTTAFLCDTQLDRVLRPETLTITVSSGGISTATVASPATLSGIKTDGIIRYQRPGITTEVYNRVVSISPSLTSMTLSAVTSVAGVCDGSLPTAGVGTTFTGSYALGIPKIRNQDKGFLYADLPNQNVSSVNLSNSTITFTAQSNTSFPGGSTSLTVNTGNFNLGINSSFAKFQAYDEERYSIFYSDGTVEPLTADKFTLSANSDQVTFSNIQTKAISAIIATFVKTGIQSKIKQYVRSQTLNVIYSKDPQSGTGINTSVNDGLIYNQFYGLRVHDEEISLNYPDVVKVLAVYESLDTSAPVLDTLSFSSIANVTTNAIIGENIIGNSSNTVARVVTKPASNVLGVVYLNNNRFSTGESVTFEESNIKTDISTITLGRYSNITFKYNLDKGQKEQYYDYSKIIRKRGESSPSRQLLIIFDYYTIPTSDSGDVFTVNSYDAKRFLSDIPNIGENNKRASDTLDFRPRVPVFTGITSSPFEFSSRSFGSEPRLILSPNEGALIGYNFYLGRIDKLFLDKFGKFTVVKGAPSVDPKAPDKPDNTIELATLSLPPYLYNPKDIQIFLSDNRRYTMRDIGRIDDRIQNLERVTSLSLLELNTQTLQIQDAQGLNRFKTGFFVDDFNNSSLYNTQLSSVQVDVDNPGELITRVSRNSLNLRPVSLENISDNLWDGKNNYILYDENVQQTGDLVTLKYDSVSWIQQTFATQVENVNPFHVISYSGTIKLNPSSDSWVRVIRLEDMFVSQTSWVFVGTTGTFGIVGSSVSTNVEDVLRESGQEIYMRSRNTAFTAVNMKPLTRLYQFLDGTSGVDFIPKLIEIANDSTLQNYGSSASFTVGETVVGYSGGVELIKFRVATSNHKEGAFNSPSVTYSTNPYVTSESISSTYTPSSKTLNVDIESLCSNVQGSYFGYLVQGMKLVGQTSGAVSYVKNLRLVTDINGFISGSFFLRDPLTTPPPAVRIAVGSKIYKLTSSPTNETPLPGSTLICSGETVYKSQGTWEKRQKVTTTTTTIYYVDPLAQSFSVGGVSEVGFGLKPGDDVNGAYLTAVDLFFSNVDPGDATVTVEVRTVDLGTPTREVLGSKTLKPSDITTSKDASKATTVTFDNPIYLAPNFEYAIVLLAPQSDQYEVWIAEMGKKTIETANLPDSQVIKYNKQFGLGSLFKSQNGTIWTANQYQDLKFKLYKAQFTASSGSAIFQNPTLAKGNSYVPTLTSNPITILPRKVTVGINTITNSSLIGILTTGRKVTGVGATYNYGYIVGTGSSVTNVAISTGGSNYNVGVVQTYNITGNGSGLRLNISSVSVGLGSAITGIAVSALNPGTGYNVGDVVGIVTSSVSPIGGRDARITISGVGSGVDTLYLSNVQGSSLNVGIATLGYYDSTGTLVSLSGTSITSSTEFGGIYSGNFFKVNHYNHGMYSSNNKVSISNIKSDVPLTTLTKALLISDTTISIASTSNFTTFEGKAVSSSNPGYVIIENEIVKYESVGQGTLEAITRGTDSTLAIKHDPFETPPTAIPVYKYEFGGVSLRRLNTTHTISANNLDIDSYYVGFDRSSNGVDRSSDSTSTSTPQLSFSNELSGGGNSVDATENIIYNTVIPHVDTILPGPLTTVTGQVRTVSGTSVNGTEVSFQDQAYENIQFDTENKLSSTRIVCSNVNEIQYLNSDAFLRGKSFTMKVDLQTSDPNISPAIFWKTSSVEFKGNRLNSPIADYSIDNRSNSIFNDPHAAVYVSNLISLSQQATSLRVIISAYRHSSADFRVLYSLVRPESSEISQSFELFPGYKNLTVDNNQDGYLDVIDPKNNSGLPDVFVTPSLISEFKEYTFTASNLGGFTGYVIKIVMSGTNQAYPPVFRDLRSIALA